MNNTLDDISNNRTEFENIVMAQTDNNVNTFENTVNLPKAKKITAPATIRFIPLYDWHIFLNCLCVHPCCYRKGFRRVEHSAVA